MTSHELIFFIPTKKKYELEHVVDTLNLLYGSVKNIQNASLSYESKKKGIWYSCDIVFYSKNDIITNFKADLIDNKCCVFVERKISSTHSYFHPVKFYLTKLI